jgi:hypothetical protein
LAEKGQVIKPDADNHAVTIQLRQQQSLCGKTGQYLGKRYPLAHHSRFMRLTQIERHSGFPYSEEVDPGTTPAGLSSVVAFWQQAFSPVQKSVLN